MTAIRTTITMLLAFMVSQCLAQNESFPFVDKVGYRNVSAALLN